MKKSQVIFKLSLGFFLVISLFITSATDQISPYRIKLEKEGKQLHMRYFRNRLIFL